MKRKFCALLCAACLLVPVCAAQAAGKVSGIGSQLLEQLQEQAQQIDTMESAASAQLEANIQAIQEMLDAEELYYTQYSDDVFSLGIRLDGTLNSCRVWLIAYDFGVHVQADYEVSATAAVRDEVAKLMIMENETLLITSYYMDYEDGLMGSQYFVLTNEATPTQDQLADALWMTVESLEDLADPLVQVLYNNKTAEEVFVPYL